MLDHKHIIRLYHAFESHKKIVMIMEYAGGGELKEYVYSRKYLEEIEARRLT